MTLNDLESAVFILDEFGVDECNSLFDKDTCYEAVMNLK